MQHVAHRASDEINQLRAQLANERAAHAVACQMRDEARTAALEEAAELLHARARNLISGKKRTNEMDRHTSDVLARARDAVRALIKR